MAFVGRGAQPVPTDDDGFSDFYREHFAALVRILHSTVPEAAEDIAQEAFAILFQRWSAVSAYDVPWAWVTLVAKRMAMRRGSRESRRGLLENRFTPAARSAWQDVDLRAALAVLPARQAAALTIHHVLDQPMGEVAQRLGCSEPAARVLVHRSRRRIAARVAGYAGRWVSDATWTVDQIAAHLLERDAAEHIGVIVDAHLQGAGGRWELTLDHGDYMLRRDDGLRLDDGSFVLSRAGVVLSPTLGGGQVTLASTLDGNSLSARVVNDTTAPTDGVPDEVWMDLFLGTSPFTWSGLPAVLV